MASRLGSRRFWLDAPARLVAGRLTFGVLAAAAVMLLVLTKLDLQVLTFLSDRAGDVAVPVLRIVNEPVRLAREGAAHLGRLLAVDAENERLREENRRLLAWQAEAIRLSVENDGLREMLRIPGQVDAPVWTTAQIVADSGGSFMQSRLIDAGTNRGIQPGMPVLIEAGLIGRVVAAGRGSARVLLVTDFASRIPVMIEGSRSRAILAGNNGPLTTLDFLPSTVRPKVGEHVLTSGDGGQLPRGLMVGDIVSVDGKVWVRPVVEGARLDWVAVLRPEPLPPPTDPGSVAPGPYGAGGPR